MHVCVRTRAHHTRVQGAHRTKVGTAGRNLPAGSTDLVWREDPRHRWCRPKRRQRRASRLTLLPNNTVIIIPAFGGHAADRGYATCESGHGSTREAGRPEAREVLAGQTF